MANGKIKLDTEVDSKNAQSGFDKLLKMAGSCANGIQSIFGSITSTIGGGVSHVISGVSSAIDTAKGSLGALGKSILEYLGANESVVGLIGKIQGIIGSMAAPIENIMNNGIAKCVGSVDQLCDSFVNANVAQDAWMSASQGVTEAMNGAFGQIDGLIQSVGQSFLHVWDNGTGTETCNLILGIITSISKIVEELAGGFKEAWDSAGVGESIVQKIWNVFNNLLGIVKTVLDSVGKFVGMIDWKPILDGIDLISGALDDITAIFDEGLQKIMDCLFGGDFSGAGQALSDTFQEAIDYVTEFIASIDWMQLGMDVAQNISDGIGAIIEFIMGIDWLGLLASIGQLCIEGLCAGLQFLGTIVLELFGQMFDAVCEFLGIDASSSKFVEVGLSILAGIQESLAGLVEWFAQLFKDAWDAICDALSGVGEFFIGCWDQIVDAFNECIDWFGQLFTDVWDAICSPFLKIGEFFSDCWNRIVAVFTICVTWFGQIFTSAWGAIKGAFGAVTSFFTGIWNSITSVFGNVVGWFRDRFTEAWTAVKNVFSAGGKIFDGIKDGILNALKAVINALINGINTIIKIPFDGINAALNAIKGVDVFGIRPFSWIGTINVPQIPKLARGGIVNRPTLAMIGEAGKEAIMPLQNNTTWMNDLADLINSRNGNDNHDNVINLYVDGEKLFQWLVKKQKKERLVLNG